MKIALRLIGDHLLCHPSGDRKIKNVVLCCLVLITSTSLPALASKKYGIINRFSCQTHNSTGKNLGVENGDENTVDDKANIFQKCLDLPELQSYYPKNADGTYRQVHVMQTPTKFPTDLAVSKFQQKVAFLVRSEIYANSIDAFLIFKDFSIKGDQAKITYDFNYNYTSSPAALEMIVMLQKTNNEWTVVDTKTNNR